MKKTLAALPAPAGAGAIARARALAAADGWELLLPPPAALGHADQPPSREALASWLEREALHAAGVLVSIDMLVYGGPQGRRTDGRPLNALLPRLSAVNRLRVRKKGLLIHAVAATQPGSIERDLAMHQALLDLVAEGVIDLLTLVQDDPAIGLHPLPPRVMLDPSGCNAEAQLLVQTARLMAGAHELARRPRRSP